MVQSMAFILKISCLSGFLFCLLTLTCNGQEICPSSKSINETAAADLTPCESDLDCPLDLKCCSSQTSKVCITPCNLENKKCKCASGMLLERTFQDGCPVCRCVAQDDDYKCLLPVSPGRCRAYIERYFFNSTSKTCEKFIFGGCDANANNFNTLEDCQKTCANDKPRVIPLEGPRKVDKCLLEKVAGSCKGHLQRYFFNKQSQMCELFVFTGCQGNENNFLSLPECIKECNPKQTYDICTLPAESGLCMAYLERFFYNATSQACESFIYGGCNANENNFKTEKECEQRCNKTEIAPTKVEIINKCDLEIDVGNSTCKADLQRYFYNKTSQMCEFFLYTGCDGNENHFASLTECIKDCNPTQIYDKCSLPVSSGRCMAYFTKFFYNSTSKKCEEFVYGGCDGNDNQFSTLKECKRECVAKSSKTTKKVSTLATTLKIETNAPEIKDRKCSLKKRPGTCHGNLQRYFYNTKTQMCELFVFTGCHGNENNFVSLSECIKECNPEQTYDICTLPAEPGLCMAYFERFFYNTTSQACEPFVYGGCNANENNFESQKDCEKKCKKSAQKTTKTTKAVVPSVNKCQLDKDSGDSKCPGRLQRYYFNRKSQKCELFIYTACNGNANNFLSLPECIKECKPTQTYDICSLPPESGMCMGFFERYFYNGTSKTCETFVYGGCNPNENNFPNLNECAKACYKNETADLEDDVEEDDDDDDDYHQDWNDIKLTLPTILTTESTVVKSTKIVENKCDLKLDNGNSSCQGSLPRYFYNNENRRCEPFIYTGCGGNLNNFFDLSSCIQECNPTQTYDKCTLPAQPGMCMAYMERFFYNLTSKACEKFVYGGCQANENNFRSKSECTSECASRNVKTPREDCLLAKEAGVCGYSIRRFYFNQDTRSCEPFNYTGCLGNNNNFLTEKECNEICLQEIDNDDDHTHDHEEEKVVEKEADEEQTEEQAEEQTEEQTEETDY